MLGWQLVAGSSLPLVLVLGGSNDGFLLMERAAFVVVSPSISSFRVTFLQISNSAAKGIGY